MSLLLVWVLLLNVTDVFGGGFLVPLSFLMVCQSLCELVLWSKSLRCSNQRVCFSWLMALCMQLLSVSM